MRLSYVLMNDAHTHHSLLNSRHNWENLREELKGIKNLYFGVL